MRFNLHIGKIEKEGTLMNATFYPNKDNADYALYIKKSVSLNNKKSEIIVESYKSIKELNLTLEQAKNFAKERIEILKELDKEKVLDNEPTVTDFNNQFTCKKNVPKNGGTIFLEKIRDELHLESLFNNLNLKGKSEIKYSLNEAVKFLTFSKILKPHDKTSDYLKNDDFINTFNISEDHLYDTLNRLSEYQSEIQNHCNKAYADCIKESNETIFYEEMDFHFKIKEEQKFEMYSTEILQTNSQTIKCGLFLNRDCLPISSLHSELNFNRQNALLQLSQNSNEDSIIGKIIVGDKTLNISRVKKKLREGNINYVFIQSLESLANKGDFKDLENTTYDSSKSSNSLQEWALNKSDMSTYKDGDDDFLYKEKLIINRDNLKERLIIKFDKAEEQSSLIQIEKRIKSAQSIIKNPAECNLNEFIDGLNFIEKIEIDKNTGTIDLTKSVLKLNKDKIETEKRFAGFCAFVTDIPSSKNLNDQESKLTNDSCVATSSKSGIEILKLYKKNAEIKKTFKNIATNLITKPIFVSNKESIAGQLVVTYLAFVVSMILKNKYAYDIAPTSLFESLRKYTLDIFIPGLFKTLYWDSNLSKIAQRTNLTELQSQKISLKGINKMLAMRKSIDKMPTN